MSFRTRPVCEPVGRVSDEGGFWRVRPVDVRARSRVSGKTDRSRGSAQMHRFALYPDIEARFDNRAIPLCGEGCGDTLQVGIFLVKCSSRLVNTHQPSLFASAQMLRLWHAGFGKRRAKAVTPETRRAKADFSTQHSFASAQRLRIGMPALGSEERRLSRRRPEGRRRTSPSHHTGASAQRLRIGMPALGTEERRWTYHLRRQPGGRPSGHPLNATGGAISCLSSSTNSIHPVVGGVLKIDHRRTTAGGQAVGPLHGPYQVDHIGFP